MRKIKNSKEKVVLHSFEELGCVFGLNPIRKQTKNKEKLENQRKRMSGTCRICGSQLSYVEGTNVFICTNPDCKGYEKTKIDEEGNEIKVKEQVYRTVDDRGAMIAAILFEEKK